MTNAAPGSGFHLLRLAIVAATLSSCLAVPWWHNPCNSSITTPPPIRHRRSEEDNFDKVRFALNIFVKELTRSFKKINETKTRYRLDVKKAFNFFKPKNISRKDMIPFLRTLQRFAGTLEMVVNQRVITQVHFDLKQRQRMYLNLTFATRQLLCEVDDFLRQNMTQKQQQTLTPRFKIKKLRQFKDLDSTAADTLDFLFLQRARKYFARARQVFKKSKKKGKAAKQPRRNAPSAVINRT